MRSVLFFLFTAAPLCWAGDFDFTLPSYVSLQGGGSDQGSRNTALAIGITLPRNWQIAAGADRGKIPDADSGEDLKQEGYSLSVASDPLEKFSVVATADTWKLEDEVEAKGGRISGTLSLINWAVTLDAAQESIVFSSLPKIIWPSRDSTVKHTTAGLGVEFYGVKNWTFKVYGARHDYDQELKDYAEGLRILVIAPSVLTATSGFTESDLYASASYSKIKWSASLRLGTSTSALDSVRTGYTGLSGTYRFYRHWSANAGLVYYQPQNSEEEAGAAVSSTGGFSYSW